MIVWVFSVFWFSRFSWFSRKRENRENARTAKTTKKRKPTDDIFGFSRFSRFSGFLGFLWFSGFLGLLGFLGFLVFWFSRFLASHRSGHVAWISCLVKEGPFRARKHGLRANVRFCAHKPIANLKSYPRVNQQRCGNHTISRLFRTGNRRFPTSALVYHRGHVIN